MNEPMPVRARLVQTKVPSHGSHFPPPANRSPASQQVNSAQRKTVVAAQSVRNLGAPPVYRVQPLPGAPQQTGSLSRSIRIGQQSTLNRSTLQPRSSGAIQRYCGTPGCNNPHCHDPSNHGHERVFGLRGRDVYHGNIGPADIGTGTGTSQGTRTYVNSIPYPQEVRIEYSSGGGVGGYSSFPNQPLAPGQRADAGHIFGAQYGGFGNQNASVFPQHPQTNRGNSYQGQSTSHLWRGHEDTVRREAQGGNQVGVSVAVHSAPRATLRNCSACGRQTFTASPNCPECGGVI